MQHKTTKFHVLGKVHTNTPGGRRCFEVVSPSNTNSGRCHKTLHDAIETCKVANFKNGHQDWENPYVNKPIHW
jgi:hypothetical protein